MTDSCAFASTQDWIRGKIPFFVPPPEPTDAAGKPVPHPLKLAGAASAEQTESAPAKVGATKSTDAEGNTVRRVPGVTQPLHQIVHSTKFLPDDVKRVEVDEVAEASDEDEEEGDEEAGEFDDDGEEWGGIESGDDEDEDDLEDDDEFEGEVGAGEVPLAWDELFAQVVGEEDSSVKASPATKRKAAALDEEEDEDEDSFDEEEDDVEIVLEDDEQVSPARSAAANGKPPAASKRSASPSTQSGIPHGWQVLTRPRTAAHLTARAIDNVSSDSEDGSRPAKEKRMTTNKKKATNFFTHANVKKCVPGSPHRTLPRPPD